MNQIDPKMFQELANRVETLQPISWSVISADHCSGQVFSGGRCSMQTYDQPGHEGLLLSTNLLPLPFPSASERLIDSFVEEVTKFLLPKVAAFLAKEEEWESLAFKNIVFPGGTGYTDTKLISLCELNFDLGHSLTQCLVGLHQRTMNLPQAAERFGTDFTYLMKSKKWEIR